ncbi:carbamoyltransferase C-terminal domain-containing protein [Streptomyces sp. NPDC044780]|uniref:carbamoyltransferase family protein n=1 Tax=unclassified Streptomyces TaxID=2593676 RepID=UPI0033C536ED
MITLGITGSFADLAGTFMPDVPEWLFHDSAAALVVDGTVVAAVEEERLNRLKHSNLFPASAAKACLELAGVRAQDVDDVAFFFGEDYADLEVGHEYLKFPDVPVLSARELLTTRLTEALGREFQHGDVHFTKHHRAHAFGSFADSGFDSALAVVIDGNGEAEGVSVFDCADGGMKLLHSYPDQHSLGHLYLALLPFLGFRRFDEYKVMGLAPYGDPSVYRDCFRPYYALLDDGGYTMNSGAVVEHLLHAGFAPRRRGEPIRQQDSDLAAALQATLEEVERHLLGHWARQTGAARLCLSGGVAHNSTANGRVLQWGLFDEVFVHPASHDAGASAGAAQHRQAEVTGGRRGKGLVNAFLGPDLGGPDAVRAELAGWRAFVDVEEIAPGEEARYAASAVASGQVVGWAHGRSEFGPRALGHRSILADPRDAGSRDRVNAMIKKREGFRPFAPAVLAESAREVFDLTATKARLDFMGCVVDVRPEWREKLPAVTHVDGSARVQTVHRDTNPVMWELIDGFRAATDVPVVLNTSFNNFAEPIVQSVGDVLRCLVTTTLDLAVVPGHAVRRKPGFRAVLHTADVVLHPATRLREVATADGSVTRVVSFRTQGAKPVAVSEPVFGLLRAAASGPTSAAAHGLPADEETLDALLLLWEHRVVDFRVR